MAIKIDPSLMERYLNAELSTYRNVDEKWVKFLRGRVWNLVPLDCGALFVIEKESIETSFCFGESGYDIDEAWEHVEQAQTNENLFKMRNLQKLTDILHTLRDDWPEDDYRYYRGSHVWVKPARGLCEFLNSGSEYDRAEHDGIELTDMDRERLITAYEECRKDMSRRIDNYLKRYGLSKVRAWTYWRDA